MFGVILSVILCHGIEPRLDWNRYQPLEDFHQFMFSQTNSSTVKLEEIGRTYEDRPILLLKVCDGECGENEVFWMDAGLHAREWIGPAVLSYVADYLMRRRRRREVRRYDWYLLLIANPDGYVETWEGDRQWRKNKNPADSLECGAKRAPAFGSGVDLNRNFGYKWEDNRLKANRKCSQNYHGLNAFSEKETRAIQEVLLGRIGNITVYTSIHSSGEKLIIPWGHSDQPYHNRDSLVQLLDTGRAAMGQHGKRYTIGNVKEAFGSFAHGGAVNWAASIGVRYPFAVELVNRRRYGRTPPGNRIKDEATHFLKFIMAIAETLSHNT